jgi:hypothetical protein
MHSRTPGGKRTQIISASYTPAVAKNKIKNKHKAELVNSNQATNEIRPMEKIIKKCENRTLSASM